MGYKVLNEKVIKNEFLTTEDETVQNIVRVFIQADDESSVPDIEDYWDVGSCCFMLDTQTSKFISTERAWV